MINNNFLSVMSSSAFLTQKIIFVVHFNKSVTNDKGEFNFKGLFKEFTVKLQAQTQDTIYKYGKMKNITSTWPLTLLKVMGF